MKDRSRFAKALAGAMVVALMWAAGPQTAAQEQAVLEGTMFAADGNAVLEGAILHAGNLRTGDIYSSTRSGADGEFVLSDLPPAAYELAVERNGGLYLVGSAVQLDAGERRKVQVAIDPQASPDPATANKVKTGIWDKPMFATLIVVASAFAVGALVDAADNSNEGLASPFSK